MNKVLKLYIATKTTTSQKPLSTFPIQPRVKIQRLVTASLSIGGAPSQKPPIMFAKEGDHSSKAKTELFSCHRSGCHTIPLRRKTLHIKLKTIRSR
eukprot:3756467-Amphidinium_carterae.1